MNLHVLLALMSRAKFLDNEVEYLLLCMVSRKLTIIKLQILEG